MLPLCNGYRATCLHESIRQGECGLAGANDQNVEVTHRIYANPIEHRVV